MEGLPRCPVLIREGAFALVGLDHRAGVELGFDELPDADPTAPGARREAQEQGEKGVTCASPRGARFDAHGLLVELCSRSARASLIWQAWCARETCSAAFAVAARVAAPDMAPPPVMGLPSSSPGAAADSSWVMRSLAPVSLSRNALMATSRLSTSCLRASVSGEAAPSGASGFGADSSFAIFARRSAISACAALSSVGFCSPSHSARAALRRSSTICSICSGVGPAGAAGSAFAWSRSHSAAGGAQALFDELFDLLGGRTGGLRGPRVRVVAVPLGAAPRFRVRPRRRARGSGVVMEVPGFAGTADVAGRGQREV